MSPSALSNHQAQVLSIVKALQSPTYEIQPLVILLIPPLKAIGLLPTKYISYDVRPTSLEIIIPKYIPHFQRALLEHTIPSWEACLRQSHNLMLLEQFFCPAGVLEQATAATDVVLCAYSTILSTPLTWLSVHLLQRISAEYPIQMLFNAIFMTSSTARQELIWEDYVRNLFIVPPRVANIFSAGLRGSVPQMLEQASYVNNICLQCERLITHVSDQYVNEYAVPAIAYLLTKLVNQGALPSTPPSARSQPSFFHTTMTSIQDKLYGPNKENYSTMWSTIIANISSRLTLRSILQSIFSSLQDNAGLEPQGTAQSRIKRNALILSGILGIAIPGQSWLWECTLEIIVNKEWDEDMIRSIVLWIANTSHDKIVKDEATRALLDTILSVWTSQTHIKHSPWPKHQYLTTLLLVTVSYLPPSSSAVQDLISSPAFLTAVGYYISHTQRSVRVCGMLAAEILSSKSGTTLTFDAWEGSDEVTIWAQHVRELVCVLNVDAKVAVQRTYPKGDSRPAAQYVPSANDELASSVTRDPDSDDSLTGYASGASSRTPSPSPSELAEGDREPLLNIGASKASAPMYLAQVVDLLGYGSGHRDTGIAEAEKIELVLQYAEDLILRKKGFGSELEENATNLTSAFLGLQDNYNLPQFDSKRQAALKALVVSCPQLAAPSLIGEFFKSQYSIAQRSSALEALASGAQELASLACPVNEATLSSRSPPIRSRDVVPENNGRAFQINKSNFKTIGVPSNQRLGNGSFPRSGDFSKSQAQAYESTSFTSLSTAYFISPLISQFWLFIRDEQARENRTVSREGRYRYHGAGTGLILNPIVLAQLLRTLTILVHLSRGSSEWLSAVAPDSLEIALTVGTMPISSMGLDEQGSASAPASNWEHEDAAVLTTALELALAVLDGCLETDNGQHLSLQQTALLQSTSDWSFEILSRVNRGLRLSGGSNVQETSLLAAVTSVLFRVDRIMSRWKRSMIGLP